VIHYQIPASVDIYVHRSGRTARGDADGLAIALVAPKEAPRYAALQQVELALCTESQIIPVTERSKKRGKYARDTGSDKIETVLDIVLQAFMAA